MTISIFLSIGAGPHRARHPSGQSGQRGWPTRTTRGLHRLATLGLLAAAFTATALAPVQAQETEAEGGRAQTQSPYFWVPGGDAALDALPLRGTQVQVRVAGVIADVTVTQTYRNEGQRAIEAKYVFPGSTRAAVHAMNVRLADRLIVAEIREKQRARLEYDTAKREGKTAALLEEHLPNVFQMNVANILPGDEVQVELRYTELLTPTLGRYQFVFPTVVGPRYNSPTSAQAQAPWVAQPILAPQQAASVKAPAFDLQVQIDSPIGLKDLRSPSHGIDTRLSADTRQASVALQADGRPAANRDFILDYRLAGEQIESGVLLYEGQDENFFLAMVQPPRAAPEAKIVPREYIFVVDVSGSMHGFPLDTTKALLRRLIGGLRPNDHFNVLLFSGSSNFLAPHSLPATAANVEQAIATIERSQGGGGTELMPALKRVYAQPKPVGRSRSIVVVTDGYVSVEREAFQLVRQNLGQANVFAFGIGSAVNRHLLEGLARAGMGEPFFITDEVRAPEQAARFRQMIESPVLSNVRARFDGVQVDEVEPPQLPDVLTERPVVLFGKWRKGAAGSAPGTLVLEGHSASGPWQQTLPFTQHAQAAAPGAALRQLWARQRIATLSDQEALEGGDAQREAITALGLKYSLLTAYTSFIAVDHVVRAPSAPDTPTVNQPVPLPQGVSPLAVGAAVPSTPEPETWGALALTVSVLAMLARRQRRQRQGYTG